MKTVPDREDIDCCDEAYANLLANWQRPEADRFGTWYDWDEDDISFLLAELRNGHWEDCGEKVPGFALATAGLNLAVIANDCQPSRQNLWHVLERIAMGVGWYMSTLFDGGDELAQQVPHTVTNEDFDRWLDATYAVVDVIEKAIYANGAHPHQVCLDAMEVARAQALANPAE